MSKTLTDTPAPYHPAAPDTAFHVTVTVRGGQQIEFCATIDGPSLRVSWDDGHAIGILDDLTVGDLHTMQTVIRRMREWCQAREVAR